VRLVAENDASDATMVSVTVTERNGSTWFMDIIRVLTLFALGATIYTGYRLFGTVTVLVGQQANNATSTKNVHSDGLKTLNATVDELNGKQARSVEQLNAITDKVEGVRSSISAIHKDLTVASGRIQDYLQRERAAFAAAVSVPPSAGSAPIRKNEERKETITSIINAQPWSIAYFTSQAGKALLRAASVDIYKSRTATEALERWKSFFLEDAMHRNVESPCLHRPEREIITVRQGETGPALILPLVLTISGLHTNFFQTFYNVGNANPNDSLVIDKPAVGEQVNGVWERIEWGSSSGTS
jgi:uncharacterized protein YoxC